MDFFEINKMIGAVLASAIVVFLINELGNELIAPSAPEGNVYVVAAEQPAEEESAAEADEGPSLGALLAAADAEAGRKAARKCAACHSFDKGGKKRVGPNLWSIVGAPKAGVDGFSYSAAMKGLGGEWGYQELDRFLADPKGYLAGTKMAFAGLKKEGQRAAVILFLRSLSDSPPALPGAD